MPRTRQQLSTTTLTLYEECPRCFWLHMVEGMKRPARPFPSITGGIDRLVQAYCDVWRPNIPPLISQAETTPECVGQWRLADPKISFLRADLGGFPLVGRLDDVVVFGEGTTAPLDHKSRGSCPNPGYSAQYYQLQMDVYALLLRSNGYGVADEAYLAYCYPRHDEITYEVDGAGFPFACTVEALPVDPDRAEAVYRAACGCLADTLPPLTVGCAYCMWAVETINCGHLAAPDPTEGHRHDRR